MLDSREEERKLEELVLKLNVLQGKPIWLRDVDEIIADTNYYKDLTVHQTDNNYSVEVNKNLQLPVNLEAGLFNPDDDSYEIGSVTIPGRSLNLIHAETVTLQQATSYFDNNSSLYVGGSTKKSDFEQIQSMMNFLENDNDKLQFLQHVYKKIESDNNVIYKHTDLIHPRYTETQAAHIEKLQHWYIDIVSQSNDPSFLNGLKTNSNNSVSPYNKDSLINFARKRDMVKGLFTKEITPSNKVKAVIEASVKKEMETKKTSIQQETPKQEDKNSSSSPRSSK